MTVFGGFTWLDLTLLLLMLFSLGIGYIQGLLRQMMGLGALYIAVVLGAQYHTVVSGWIRAITFQTSPSRFLSAISFFIIVFVTWSVISWLVFDAYRSTKLKLVPLVDHLGGSAVALIAMVCTITLVLPVLSFAVTEPWPWSETVRFWLADALQRSPLVHIFDLFKPAVLAGVKLWLPAAALPSIFTP